MACCSSARRRSTTVRPTCCGSNSRKRTPSLSRRSRNRMFKITFPLRSPKRSVANRCPLRSPRRAPPRPRPALLLPTLRPLQACRWHLRWPIPPRIRPCSLRQIPRSHPLIIFRRLRPVGPHRRQRRRLRASQPRPLLVLRPRPARMALLAMSRPLRPPLA